MKINTRSPYHINTTKANLTSATIDLYIYTGTQTSRGAITYSLHSTAYNNKVTFEISQLVRDYLDVAFAGSYTSQVVFVDYQITQYVNLIAETPLPIVELTAFDGYGNFEDGNNPQLTNKLLQSNTDLYVLDGNYFYVPIQQDLLTKVDLIKDGVILYTQTFTPTTLSDDVVRYIFYTVATDCVSTSHFLFESGENYLFEDSNYFIFSDGLDIDSMLITYSDASTQTVNLKIIQEQKYTPKKLAFVNKFGVLQDLWFFKANKLSLQTSKNDFKRSTISDGGFSISDHQKKILNKQGVETLILNSGFYPESHNEVFKQLLLSEQVWIETDGQTLPVNITDSSFNFKTSVNDGLINYTVNLEFAFDKINNVR